MANLRLNIDPTGAVAGGKVAENALDRVKTKAGLATAAAKTLGAAFVAISAALGAGLAIKNFVSATDEAEKVQAQLAAAIKSTGGAAGKTLKDLNATAVALQKVTNYGDETISTMQGMLLTFTEIKGVNFDRATVAIQDVATAMQVGLKEAAIQVGKALNDPILGITALARTGIQFTESQKATIKSMVEMGDTAGAQVAILKELERQFGGSARAARETLGGALTSLGNAWGDLFELAGPASENLRASLERLITTISSPGFAAAIQGIGTAVFNMLDLIARGLSAAANAVSFITKPISAAIGFVDRMTTSQETLNSVTRLLAEGLGQEVRGLNQHNTSMGEAKTISLQFAESLLIQSTGYETLARAKIADSIATAKSSDAYRKLRSEMDAVLSNINQTIASQSGSNPTGFEESDLLRLTGRMNDLRAAMDAMTAIPPEVTAEFERTQQSVIAIRAAIAAASNETVTLAGTAGTVTTPLKDADAAVLSIVGNIGALISGLSGAAGNAGALAGNLRAAAGAMEFLSRTKKPDTTALGFGLPSVGDPTTGSQGKYRFGEMGAPGRRDVIPLAPSALSSGSSSAGGGAASIDTTRSAYDALVGSLDPAIRASLDFAAAQKTIGDAVKAGSVTATEAAHAYELVQERFDEATAAAHAGAAVWGEFETAAGNAIDKLIEGTGSLRDVLKEMIKELALAVVKANLLRNVTGGTSSMSVGQLIVKGLFGGLFDSGGTIGMGKTGIVGERGPERVTATSGGAVVTSRADTARMAGGRQEVAVRVEGGNLTMSDNGQIMANVRVIAQSQRQGAVSDIRRSFGNIQQEYNMSGGLVA